MREFETGIKHILMDINILNLSQMFNLNWIIFLTHKLFIKHISTLIYTIEKLLRIK